MDDIECKGRLILFFQHGKIATGFCVDQNDSHLDVLYDGGRHVSLPAVRILHSQLFESIDTEPAEKILARLSCVEEKQIHLAETIDPESLWSKIDRTSSTYSPAELAREVFGAEVDSDHLAAVVRALHKSSMYFKFDGKCYCALSPQQVDKARRRVVEEKARRMEIEQCAAWLHAYLHAHEVTETGREQCIGYLKQFAIFGTSAAQYETIRLIFKQTGAALERSECFNLLVRLGVCSPDENLLFERHGVPCEWSDEVLRTVDMLIDLDVDSRCDLTSLEVCSIDDPGTRDIDDAISFEPDGDNLRVGIHITDAASLLLPGSVIDLEASQRATSLYFPEGATPMLPPALSEKRLSLIAGETRPVVSVFVVLDLNGVVHKRTLQLSNIRVTRRLSYKDVDDDILAGGRFKHLYDRLMHVRDRRLADGASALLVPELQVKLDRDREVALSVRERETPAQALVAESMILANHSAALFLKQHNVPALYRTQKRSRPAAASVDNDMPMAERVHRRHAFNRTILSTASRSHAGLGLDCYCSTTSPMRKYLDLVMQRQLVAALQAKAPVYADKALRDIASAVQPALTRASLVENERKRYWLFKKMEPLQGQVLQAVVVERRKKKLSMFLPDFLFEVSAAAPEGGYYEPGSEVQVVLKDVNPFDGSISIDLLQGCAEKL